MSHRREKRARKAIRLALMTAVSFDASMAAHYAIAADPAPTSETAAKPDDLDEIVVTGFRESLESALNRKRTSIQPIESVVAEDLGKMPDQDVSESLQRLPGVSINRSDGKGTQVLIDGLRNNLITLNGEVLLTGREIYVSGESSGGGGNAGLQYASLEGIPTEEIGGIDVIKNPTAQNREGGLGGIVDIKTRSPLAQDMGLNLAGNLRGTKAENADGGPTPVGALVGGYKFNDSLAITGSVSYDDTKTHDKQFQDQNRNQWLITNTATVGSYVGSPIASTNTTLPGGRTYIDPQLAYFSDIMDQIETKGATLGAEWKWNDDITSSFNWFFIDEEEVSTTYSNKAWFSGGSGETNHQGAPASFPGIDPTQPYSIDGNGVVQSGTFLANDAETATLYESDHTKANNFQLNTKFAGDWPVTGDFGLAYAKATGDYEAAQADVEHGEYAADGSPNPSIQPDRAGLQQWREQLHQRQSCLCVGLEQWWNLGTSVCELPQQLRLLERIVQSRLHVVQIQLGMGEQERREDLGGQIQPAFQAERRDRPHRGRPLSGSRSRLRSRPVSRGRRGPLRPRRHRRRNAGGQLLHQPRLRHLAVLSGSGVRKNPLFDAANQSEFAAHLQ